MMPMKVNLTRACLIAVPPQHQQYYRPYEGYFSNELLDKAITATDGGNRVTKERLSGIASQIITPSFEPAAVVNIQNGFGEMRFAFIIEITIESIHGIEREVIKGYTNTANISFSGHIDPEMEFYINSRILLRGNRSAYDNGIGPNVLKHNYNVLSEATGYDKSVGLRPEDVFNWQQMQLYRMGDEIVYDGRSILTAVPKFADVNHNLPSRYLNDTFNSYIKSLDPVFSESDNPHLDLLDNAIIHVATESSQLSCFYNELSVGRHRGLDKITYGLINHRWPTPPGFWTVIMPGHGKKLSSPLEHTQHWHGANVETSIAYSLTHMLPAIMADYMLEKLVITMTNMTIGYRPIIQAVHYVSLIADSMSEATINNLYGRLELDVIHGMILQKAVTFNITMEINLFTTSKFTISINDMPGIPYESPMFCDSYYSPMIGLEPEAMVSISDTVENLSKGLTANFDHPHANAVNRNAVNVVMPGSHNSILNAPGTSGSHHQSMSSGTTWTPQKVPSILDAPGIISAPDNVNWTTRGNIFDAPGNF